MTLQATRSTQTLRMGIIGATPKRGWAAMAHIPALRALPHLALHAVATRNEQSARAAAAAFGAPLWFDNASAMIAHDEVDAVVVAVKAPDHHALVKQALLAGKPVYCEMPFGHTLEEARELERLAREGRITTAVGLQGRFSPWVRQVRELVTAGRLGRILSTSLIVYDELSLGSVDQGNAYLLDVTNGANPLTIHSGHYLDALCFALGELATVSAMTAISRPRVVVRQTGETLTSTSPDQIAVCGLLHDGAMVSFHLRAGSGDPSFLWEIQGESAVLRITSKGYLMWRPLKLELWDARAKQWDAVPPPDLAGEWEGMSALEGPAQFVARVYAAFAEDILTGSTKSVSFSDALGRRETMEAIRAAAHDGVARSPAAATKPR
jgi:predicted dehydrogenase